MLLTRHLLAPIVLLVLTAACGVDLAPPPPSHEIASGTWSIVAVDVKAAEAGTALASCLRADFSIIVGQNDTSGQGRALRDYRILAITGPATSIELARVIPGEGVIVAQARVDRHNTERIDRAAAELLAGASARRVVEAATEADPQIENRQYGVVTFGPEAASFTGSEALDWAGAASGRSVSVQGNILVGPEVVHGALEAFQQAMNKPDATLGDALITALEAGAAQGGDKRCPRQQTALSAFVAVARSDDQGDIPSLWLTAPAQQIGEQNPVNLLRQAYDEGRSSSPETPSAEGDGPRTAWWGLTALALPLAGIVVWLARRAGRRASR